MANNSFNLTSNIGNISINYISNSSLEKKNNDNGVYYISNILNESTGEFNIYTINPVKSIAKFDTDQLLDVNDANKNFQRYFNNILNNIILIENDYNNILDKLSYDERQNIKNTNNVYLLINNLEYVKSGIKYVLFDEINNYLFMGGVTVDITNAYISILKIFYPDEYKMIKESRIPFIIVKDILESILPVGNINIVSGHYDIEDNIYKDALEENITSLQYYERSENLKKYIYINFPRLISKFNNTIKNIKNNNE